MRVGVGVLLLNSCITSLWPVYTPIRREEKRLREGVLSIKRRREGVPPGGLVKCHNCRELTAKWVKIAQGRGCPAAYQVESSQAY